ncbi:MAG TPA: hypothetical protein ENJ46_03835, partial [Hellea balneolensis]|nr:hypothetical protein [Hellea balneolensis]
MQDHHKPQALKKPIANWKYIPVAILIVLVFFVILHKLKRDPIQQPIMNLQPWALQTDVVKTGNVNAIFPALGKVESSSEITLA